ncbi:MAG: polysaccharide biosynthesis/export family protein [Kiritimatiellia bacterium]
MVREFSRAVASVAVALWVAGCATDSHYAEFSEVLREGEYIPLADIAEYVAAEASTVPESLPAVKEVLPAQPVRAEPVAIAAPTPGRSDTVVSSAVPVRVSVPSPVVTTSVPIVKTPPSRTTPQAEVETVLATRPSNTKDVPEPPPLRLPTPMEKIEKKVGRLTIQPDSIVKVWVEEDPSLDGSYQVNAIGAIQLKYVGPVILYNKTEEEAAAEIAKALQNREFRKATVKVEIVRPSYDKIQVSGEVLKPGFVQIGPGDTISLNDALLRAGGVIPSSRAVSVKIVRDGLLSPMALAMPGEVYSLVGEDGLPRIPDVQLANNDLVHVFSIGPVPMRGSVEKEILVLGEVRRPGYLRFGVGERCTIMGLILKMGGLPPYANPKKIKVLRRDKNGYELEYIVDARNVMKDGNPEEDFVLENGDRVIVPARRITLF